MNEALQLILTTLLYEKTILSSYFKCFNINKKSRWRQWHCSLLTQHWAPCPGFNATRSARPLPLTAVVGTHPSQQPPAASCSTPCRGSWYSWCYLLVGHTLSTLHAHQPHCHFAFLKMSATGQMIQWHPAAGLSSQICAAAGTRPQLSHSTELLNTVTFHLII